MKLRTKILSLFLAAIFFFGVFPAPAYAAIRSEVVGDEYVLQNDYIKVTVNSKTGRFSIGTVEGQPVRKNDQNTLLTFIGGLFGAGRGDSDTSFTTFRINGTDYIFGNSYDFTAPDGREVKSEMGSTDVFTHDKYEQIPEGCQAAVTEWSVEGVHIMQVLLIYPDTGDQKDNSGNVQVFYNVDNRSGASVNVGARILLDTMVGANDGPQMQLGTISENTLSVERMLTRDPHRDQGIAYENQNYWTLPDYWVMKDTLDPTNPLATNVIAYGYTDIAGYRDVDYMVVSHWNKLANEKFEEFEDYIAIPAEMSEAASAVSTAQRVRDLLIAAYESKEADAISKAAAYEEEKAAKEGAEGAESSEGKTKLQLDAEEARAAADKVKTALDRAEQNLLDAQANFEALSGGRKQIGDSMIDPNLDFTVDTNAYGSADSAVAFYWAGDGDSSVIPANASMQIGTVFGLGEIIDPASVLALTFPSPVTQVEVDPDNTDAYENYGIFNIEVEVENLALYNMRHDYVDVTMTLENNLRFVKRDESGNLVMGEDGKPQTLYNSTLTKTFQKAVTPEQAEKGENNPILPGEKVALTFEVMAIGKSWPTTRQYMVTATSPQLETEFENLYGDSAGEDIKALYNSSRSNFIFLPAVGHGTPSYSVSVSPDECFAGDVKYITVNMTNIEAYNPGSSIRGQETAPNFNLYLEEIVTGNRYQIDVTDNVQCVVTDDGLTGDMRITYADGTLVDADGVVLQTNLGPTLPVGEYRVRIDYISTDEDENAMLDMVSGQTFLVTTNDEARIREPGVLAVVKETIPFDDGEIMQKITELVEEVENAIDELSKIADKLSDTDWADAIYDEVIDLAKEIISPVTQIYDQLEKLVDFKNIESEMRALSKDFDELSDVDFSELKNFDLMKAIKGVNVDISLSDYFKELFDVETMILGPLGLSGLTSLGDEGVDGLVDQVKNYGKSFIDPFTDVYAEIVELGDFSDLSNNEIAQLKNAFSELADVDFTALKKFDLGAALKGIYDGTEVSVGTKLNLADRFKKLTDIESLLLGPFASGSEGGGVEGVYQSILAYGKDMIAPIVNIYDEIIDIADFSTLTDTEIAEMTKAYTELESLDFSELEKLDFDKLLDSIDVSIKLSDKFEELLDVERLIGGPFASLLSDKPGEDKSLGDQLYDWVLGYAKKMAAPLISIYDDIEDLADFDDIVDEMRELAKVYPELADVDFSGLADFDFAEALSRLNDSLDVNISLKDNFKKIFDYESILAGPFSGVKDENGNEKSALDVFTDRILAYGEKMIRPVVSIYEDFEKITDFEGITKEMNEIAKIYPELADVDFSTLEGFDFAEALAAVSDSLDASISLKDNFKKIFDYESILAGPFSGVKDENGNEKSALDVFTDRILAYGEKMIRPVVSIYEDIEKLADFSDIEKEMEELAKIYPELANVDFSSLADFDFTAAISGVSDSLDVNVSLKDNFKKIFDYESILAGPFSGVKDENGNEKSALDVFTDRILAYGEKMIRPVVSIYEDIEKLADFDDIVKDMEAIAKEYDGVAGLDFSALEDFDLSAAIKDLWNATNVNVDLSDGFKQTMQTILDGPFENGSFTENAFNTWIAALQGLYNDGNKLYDVAKKAYNGSLGAKEGAAEILAIYKKYVNSSISLDLDAAISEATKSAASQTWTNSKKIGLAFVAIYAKMQSIYESIDQKYNKAKEVYNDVVGIKDKVVNLVKAVSGGDLSELFSLGKDMLQFIFGEWLDPVFDAIDSAKTLYSIGKKAYDGDLSVTEGAKLLMHFYEEYLDVSVKVDFTAIGDGNTAILSDTAANAKKLALAFTAMYAKMQNIYASLDQKYNKAKEVYNDVIGIKDKIVDFVKAIGNGDFSQLLSLGKDMLQFILGEWLNPVYDAIDSAKTLYSIGKKASEGNLSVTEGAKLLMHFYEEYLDVSVDVDFKGLGDKNNEILSESAANAKKLGLAFTAMYARMQNIYDSVAAKYNKAKDVYDSVIGIKDKIVNFIKAIGNGDISELLSFGKDVIEFVFGEWLNPVFDAIDSAKTLYAIGKKAYEGKLSIEEGGKLLMHFYEEYLDVSVNVDFKGIGDKNTEILSESAANAKKLGLAFMAMYAKMKNVYENISNKLDRATQVYDDVRGLIDTVIRVGGQVLDGDFSAIISALKDAGADLFNNVLEAWLTPIMDTIDSAKNFYNLAKSAYNGEIGIKKGAKLLMDFFGTYLDIDVDADFSVLKNAGGEAYTNYQKISAAFMIMYARLGNIFRSIESKVDRATRVYEDAKSLVNTIVKIVKAIGDGDFSVLLDKIMEVGKDLIGTIINYWLGQFQDVIDAGNEIYDIARHAFAGDISVEEGAKLLVNFYENYLNVSVKVDFNIGDENAAALSDAQKQAQQMAAAFKVMFVQMKSIYSKLSSKIDKAKNIYDQAKSLINNIIKLIGSLSDPAQLLNDVVDLGKDSIMKVLNAYMDKINEMIQSVKDIYEVGKKAYEGKISIIEGAEALIAFFQKYLKVSISADLDAVGEENKKAASETYKQGKKMALAFVAMFAKMKNLYSSFKGKIDDATSIYDEVKDLIDSVVSLFTDPAKGAYALFDLVKARIMKKLDGLGMYKDMFMEVLDVIENFDQLDAEALLSEAGKHIVDVARVKADQALYTEIYGLLMTGATALDPNSDYDWDPGTLLKNLPTYRLMTFEDEIALKEYQDKVNEENQKKKDAAKKGISDPEKAKAAAAKVGNDGVMVKVTGMIRQLGEGKNVTDYIVDTSSEPAIINDTVAFTGSDLIFTNGKLKISVANFTLDAGEYISKAQSLYGSETPLFDTLIVSGTGQLYIEGSGYIFHDGEWSIDFYNGFDKILDPVEVNADGTKTQDAKKSDNEESGFLNETAAWAIGALNDLVNPLKALAITDVYFNRHTLFSAPSFSVAGFGLKFDNYLLRSSEVCFGGHIDFKIVTGEIQNVFFNSAGLQSIEADLKFDLGKKVGLLEEGEAAGGNLIIHYYDPDYRASFAKRGYPTPEEKYQLDFAAKLRKVGGVSVLISFKRVADGRILPDIIGFSAQPPAPGILVTGGTYLTELRGVIKELADTIAGGSSTVPLTVEAGARISFGQAPAIFDGKIDMILKMTGIELNGVLDYKGKPMITMAQIKAQWVTPWFVSAAMEMDVMGLNVIIGRARVFIGQNLEKNRTDFEGFVSAALQIPKSVPVVGGFQLGQVSFGLNNDKIWGSASVGIAPVAVGVGITYYWGGGIEFGTDGEGLPDAYSYLVLEKPEEEPVLIAIGNGMQTEATSWLNDNAIHEIVYHAIEDGVSILDNGQNDIGIGGIEVTSEGKTHIIPVGNIDDGRDALIEVEYYGEDLPQFTLVDENGKPYDITYGTVGETQTPFSAFKQDLQTTDGVTRKLVYVMLPRTEMTTDSYTLTASERVQTKLLSTPTASSISKVELADGGKANTYTATVTVANRHEGDTLSLYLTKEEVGTNAVEKTVEGKDGEDITVTLTEDNDPGVMIYDGIPVESDTVTQTFDVSNIDGDYAVSDLGDIRELLESGNYYLRAALKSDTAYSAMTGKTQLTLTDPKAPGAAHAVKLVSAGGGYFSLSFTEAQDQGGNTADGYRVDFYDDEGMLYTDYNGILFTAEDIAEFRKDGTYTFPVGGRAVTGGTGTDDDPFTYSGLETGKEYIAKVYAYHQTEDENYHYASAAASSLTLLPVPEYAKVTSLSSESGTISTYSYRDPVTGTLIATTAKQLVTNAPAPVLNVGTDLPASIEAYIGDTYLGTAEGGVLALDTLTVDGDYAVELRLTNPETGDMSVAVVYVTIDTKEPTIFITAPTSRTKTASEFVYDDDGEAVGVLETPATGSLAVDFRTPVKIEGSTEAGSTVKANGVSLTVDENGKFSGGVTLPAAAAKGEIKLVATDKAGNVNTAKMTVTNKSFGIPVGLNILRLDTLKVGDTDTAEIYLNYADKKVEDGKNDDGSIKYRQTYRSELLSADNMGRVTFKVERGDAVSIAEDGTITALRSGAALISAEYKITDDEDSAVLMSTIPVRVEDEKTESVLRGDVNGDGEVTSDDAIRVLYYALLPDQYTVNQSADFNHDAAVTSDDAIYLLYATLLPTLYPLY